MSMMLPIKKISGGINRTLTSLKNMAATQREQTHSMPDIRVGSRYGNFVQKDDLKRLGNRSAGSARVPPMRGLIVLLAK